MDRDVKWLVSRVVRGVLCFVQNEIQLIKLKESVVQGSMEDGISQVLYSKASPIDNVLHAVPKF